MPIRFRCAYCQQLMGIARRKAGAIVRCPRCAGEVIVPPTHEIPDANGAGELHDLQGSEEFGEELAALEPAGRNPGAREAPNPLLPPPSYTHAPLAAGQAPPVRESTEASAAWNVRRSGVFMSTPMLIVSLALLVASLAVTF